MDVTQFTCLAEQLGTSASTTPHVAVDSFQPCHRFVRNHNIKSVLDLQASATGKPNRELCT